PNLVDNVHEVAGQPDRPFGQATDIDRHLSDSLVEQLHGERASLRERLVAAEVAQAEFRRLLLAAEHWTLPLPVAITRAPVAQPRTAPHPARSTIWSALRRWLRSS